MLAIHVLASGSKGNASIVENLESGEGVLVDCGICKRDFMARSEEAGFDVNKLRAILVTHDHSDHVGNLGVVMRGLRGIEYCMYALNEVIQASEQVSSSSEYCEIRCITFGEPIHVAGISVKAFPTSHDAAASCGFTFTGDDGDAIGFMTDTGYATQESLDALDGVRILALESNHDPKMLEEGEYPSYLKRRISSDRGHLSNGQAKEILQRLSHEGLEHVVAMHLSEKNNLPSIVKDELSEALRGVSSAAQLHVASQTRLVSVS